MMNKEALERQSTLYLKKLEVWQLIRWKRRLELINETTNDLWLIRKVLKERKDSADKHFSFPRDEDAQIGTMTESYREHLLNDSY